MIFLFSLHRGGFRKSESIRKMFFWLKKYFYICKYTFIGIEKVVSLKKETAFFCNHFLYKSQKL